MSKEKRIGDVYASMGRMKPSPAMARRAAAKSKKPTRAMRAVMGEGVGFKKRKQI
ncbi:MAG: hypothetical protein WC767_03615 [Candidatus Paceibacterota bacterium]|jgi:hypothetical protein